VERYLISCESCEKSWILAGSLSLYEQQTRESNPCPHCGAYTLRCQTATANTILELPRQRLATAS
jgi:predicted RNA-binding Zn-ribbon protein involved in translation (DUF1610 family)